MSFAGCFPDREVGAQPCACPSSPPSASQGARPLQLEPPGRCLLISKTGQQMREKILLGMFVMEASGSALVLLAPKDGKRPRGCPWVVVVVF